jgi:hypothetical protein
MGVDVEEFLMRGREDEIPARLQAALDGGSDVAVSWGFWPGKDEQRVRDLQAGTNWRDGDREVARRMFINRGHAADVRLFDTQIKRIVAMDVASFGAAAIDPFDEQGARLPRERLAEAILPATRPAQHEGDG